MVERAEGPTPAGGAYSIAVGFDHAGVETTIADAMYIKISEYDEDDRVIARTTMGHIVDRIQDLRLSPLLLETAGSSTEPDSLDMTKGTWDVRNEDGSLVEDLVSLILVLGWTYYDEPRLKMALANLTAQPSWNPAPARLRRETSDFLLS